MSPRSRRRFRRTDVAGAALSFFLALLIEGALAGAIYALIALAFVLVYKSSRMINFALGEWIMFGALLAGAGYHALGLGFAGAGLFPPFGMALFGVGLYRGVVGGRPGAPLLSPLLVQV